MVSISPAAQAPGVPQPSCPPIMGESSYPP